MWRNAPAGPPPAGLPARARPNCCAAAAFGSTRVHYEDFVREPRRTVEVALSGLGLPVEPAQLSHIGDGRVVLGHTHGLSGNPSRFRYGEIVLRADEAWRDQMRRRDRLIVTMVALPLPAALRRCAQPGGQPQAAARQSPARPPQHRRRSASGRWSR